MMMSSSLLLDIFELIHRADVGTIQLVKNFPDHFVFARVYEGGWRVIKSNARYINVSELAWNGIEFPSIVYVWVEENWPVGPFLFTCNNRHWKVKKKNIHEENRKAGCNYTHLDRRSCLRLLLLQRDKNSFMHLLIRHFSAQRHTKWQFSISSSLEAKRRNCSWRRIMHINNKIYRNKYIRIRIEI